MSSLPVTLCEIGSILNRHDPVAVPALQDSLAARLAALDVLEVDVLDRLDSLASRPDLSSDSLFEISALRRDTVALTSALQALNETMYAALRAEIRGGLRGTVLRDSLIRHAGSVSSDSNRESAVGYDALDEVLNGIFSTEEIPVESREPEAEMVWYQKTPGKVLFEVVNAIRVGENDVFYDLGSGLGQVPLLVHLLTGVVAKGVEFEPAYVRYSERCARELGLTKVSFLSEDVRHADLSDGTLFFLYTPFTGKMLETVLEKLREVSERHPICILTYGPCTQAMAQQTWLKALGPKPSCQDGFAVFASERDSNSVGIHPGVA
jgi:hypothetical protein